MGEELTQETLLAAWRLQRRLSNPGGAVPWLAAIARNMYLHWRRRHIREQARRVRLDDTGAVRASPVADDRLDLTAELEQAELAMLLDRALADLPAATRAALIGRYVEGLPQAKLAARHGISEGAVEARLQRGKRALRLMLNTTLRDEAAAYGLADSAAIVVQERRIWCARCGLAAAGTGASLHTLLQGGVPDAYRGRVFAALGTLSAVLELLSVGLAGVLGETLGIVPLLNAAAAITILAGLTALLLPAAQRCESAARS